MKIDLLLEQRVGADDELDLAGSEATQHLAALRPAFAARQDRDVDAGRCGKRRNRRVVLAREKFGRRHQRRLPAGFDHGGGSKQRHHGLAGADVALQQPQHALRLAKVGGDVVDGLQLRFREPVGQRCDHFVAQPPVASDALPCRTTHVRAHERQRQLARQQFIVGEPRPRLCVGLHIGRLVRDGAAGRARPRMGAIPAAAASSRPAIPAVAARARRAASDRLPDLRQAQAFGERIGRLHQRQLGEAGLVHDAIRVHHLQHAVVEGDRA